MCNLDKIAKDLMYYGYNFAYFYENYCQGLEKDYCKNIWLKVREKLETI